MSGQISNSNNPIPHLQQLQQQLQEKEANDIIQAHIKITSALFDKSIAYTNVIIIGGYAGFFGLWSLTKQYLTVRQASWAALFMLLSVCTFVLFEVYKMVISSNDLHDRAKIVKDPKTQVNPDVIRSQLREMDQSIMRRNVSFIRVWRINVFVAVAAALVAIGILLSSFVCALIRAT